MIHLGVREELERREHGLSPHAARSYLSLGRLGPDIPDLVRTSFQRDRDRIVHSKAFYRLKHKTQVFIAPPGDHYATRLTHALQVSQIARTIARALNLNEDLTEAISLGHDLGHTPFGHAGEDVLDRLYPGGFRHNHQSLRVVDVLENEGRGLNLTWEVREGILNHAKTHSHVFGEGWGASNTLEGQICKVADVIAYLNHDLNDALRAGIVTTEQIPAGVSLRLGKTHSERIDALVCDVIDDSWAVRAEEGSNTGNRPSIGMSAGVQHAADELREFLFDRVYRPISAKEETLQAVRTVETLYAHCLRKPDVFPEEYRSRNDSVERKAADYIAGMTDQFATRMYEDVVGHH